MIRIPAGFGLTDVDDAAVTCLREGCELHRLAESGTVCGLPDGQLVHPYPSVNYASMYAASLCRSCWPQPSVWAVLLRRAHPDHPRRFDANVGPKFGPLNDSRTRPGVGQPTKGI